MNAVHRHYAGKAAWFKRKMNNVQIIRPATVSRHEKLQNALIEAAERAIATQGLGALRARALAEEVGCAVGAIYTIFPDLDGIILAANSRTLIQIDTLCSAGRVT